MFLFNSFEINSLSDHELLLYPSCSTFTFITGMCVCVYVCARVCFREIHICAHTLQPSNTCAHTHTHTHTRTHTHRDISCWWEIWSSRWWFVSNSTFTIIDIESFTTFKKKQFFCLDSVLYFLLLKKYQACNFIHCELGRYKICFTSDFNPSSVVFPFPRTNFILKLHTILVILIYFSPNKFWSTGRY